MNKTLFSKQIFSLLLALGLCSFAFLKSDEDPELKKDELSYLNTKIELSFGGIEEVINLEHPDFFRTNIYLSDIDLNNATQNSNEQISMVLKNFMLGSAFENGQYAVNGDFETVEPGVKVEFFTLKGAQADVSVVSGKVFYAGQYPQVSLELDLKLSNGENLKGSYSKKMQSFKYYF